jgi:hypothetical protein
MTNMTISHDATIAAIQALREWLALNPNADALHKAHVLDMIDTLGIATHVTIARKYSVPPGWDSVES